ncbi:MAG: type I DNA topoisomerase [Clostridia bacterium]|jgi:DNA topoisomerase-1|nr:type I DNA topoisomerase [Clostridia bacterium]
MAKNLVIVESPAKAKTIKKILGSSYNVIASNGHLRDLPKSQLGVDVENDFEPKYITIRGKGDKVKEIKSEVKKAKQVYLATDPDREGEAISWHLKYLLGLDEYKRITFNEITKEAIKKSIKSPREIEMELVDSQQARRVLDRIVGYKISPLLWKKVRKGLSAGRVQSVALRLVVEREMEIEDFNPEEYWKLNAKIKKVDFEFFGKENKKVELKSEEEVEKVLNEIDENKFEIVSISSKDRKRSPNLPFITSTLQQEAFKNLGYTTKKTMSIAQRLYEAGYISYIRTDSYRVSDEARTKAVEYIENNLGKEYVGPGAKSKNKKGAQDAHEAIRPSYPEKEPISIKEKVKPEEYKVYKLIWERFIASQMVDAIFETVQAKAESNGYEFRANGNKLKFDGYLKVYSYSKNKDELLPELNEGDKFKKVKIDKSQHFTKPPARYTEASLVKKMEENGVGRPSTYSAVISTIQQRRYVLKEEKKFYPTELGIIVDDIMQDYFKDIVEIDFTADLEAKLDEIESGNIEWKEVIKEFYNPFAKLVDRAENEISKIEIKDEVTDIDCELCGRKMVIKYGRYGKFLACPGFPECRNVKSIFEELDVPCPKCGKKVYIKKTKKGRIYYGCEDNPECDFMSWEKPLDKKCEECGEILYEQGRKNKKEICKNEKCSKNNL